MPAGPDGGSGLNFNQPSQPLLDFSLRSDQMAPRPGQPTETRKPIANTVAVSLDVSLTLPGTGIEAPYTADSILPSAQGGNPGVWITDGVTTTFLSSAGHPLGSTLQYNGAGGFAWVP